MDTSALHGEPNHRHASCLRAKFSAISDRTAAQDIGGADRVSRPRRLAPYQGPQRADIQPEGAFDVLIGSWRLQALSEVLPRTHVPMWRALPDSEQTRPQIVRLHLHLSSASAELPTCVAKG